MNLSISTKIYLIPIIGSISFFVFLSIASVSAYSSIRTLFAIKEIHFPVVQLSENISLNIIRISDLLKIADTLMYDIKQTSKNSYKLSH